MTVQDPEKNKAYVAKHRAMKKANEETKKQYNELNASYVQKYRQAEKETLGEEEYKKKQAEYMKQYRAQKKSQQKQVEQKKTEQNQAIIKIQNAIRNKRAIEKVSELYVEKKANIIKNALKARKARKEVLSLKMDKANELVSQINQAKQEKEREKERGKEQEIAKNKLNALAMAEEMLNDLIPQALNTIPEKRKPGRPRLPRRPVGRPRGSKNKPKD
jgi:hypothetical protein